MRILLVEPNWIGDVILTTPALKALKNKFNNAFIGCAVAQRCKDILLHNPHIDEIIEFNERVETKTLAAKLKFIKTIKKAGYDSVVLFHRSFTRTLLCAAAGISQRLGYAYKKRSFLLTEKVRPPDKNKIHKQDYYLGVLKGLDITIEDKSCKVYITDQEHYQAKQLINNTDNSPLIAINPFTNWQPKNWPLDSFKQLIELINQKYPKARFFITSAKNTPQLLKLSGPNIVNLAAKTNLRQLAALYEQMDLVISADSGPLHLAAAVETKYIGIYGATDPKLNAPRSSAKGAILFNNNFCSLPCYITNCDKAPSCMETITARQTADTAISLLK